MPKVFYTPDGYPYLGDEVWQNPFDDSNTLAPIVNERAAQRVRNAVVKNGVAPQFSVPAGVQHAWNTATGSNGEERYQFWPERMVREAIGTVDRAAQGEYGGIPKPNAEGAISDEMIGDERARDFSGANALSNLVMGGGMPIAKATGVLEHALGTSGGKLRPAIEYDGKVYQTEPGTVHGHVIDKIMKEKGIDPDKADYGALSEGAGFVTPEGKFLDREEAFRYAQKHDQLTKGAKSEGSGELDAGDIPGAVKFRSGSDKDSIAPVWYSASENAVANSSNEFASGAQWLGMLKNAKGLKKEELEWLGLEDFLKDQPKVSKADLEAYIRAHKVEVKDALNTNKSDDAIHGDQDAILEQWNTELPPTQIVREGAHYLVKVGDHTVAVGANERQAKLALEEFKDAHRAFIRTGDEFAEGSQGQTLADYAFEAAGNQGYGEGGSAGRYQQYQLPGGKNYNELLLTLPPSQTPKWSPDKEALYNKYATMDYDKRVSTGVQKEYENLIGERDENKSRLDFHSSHWDEPNVLAHVRFNERTINGKKTLFIEEAQSDWHQQGHKSGYKGQKWQWHQNSDKKDPMGMIEYASLPSGGNAMIYKYPDGDFGYSGPHGGSRGYKTIEDVKERAQNTLDEVYGAVPDAPFKKNWHELVTKRMMRYAAENGYDAIAWTPSEVQNARWPGSDHSKLYDEMLPQAAKKFASPHGGKIEQAELRGAQQKETRQNLVPNADDFVIESDVSKPNEWIVRNQKTGEELLKTHDYDKALKETAQYRHKPIPVHYLELPQGVKDTAMRKGFPLFVNGVPLIPVDHDPFNTKKKDKDQDRVPQGNKTPKFQPERIGAPILQPGAFK